MSGGGEMIKHVEAYCKNCNCYTTEFVDYIVVLKIRCKICGKLIPVEHLYQET